MTKLEGRIRDLENELEAEQRRTQENTKFIRKLERKYKGINRNKIQSLYIIIRISRNILRQRGR